MAKKRFRPEEIINKHRHAAVLLGQANCIPPAYVVASAYHADDDSDQGGGIHVRRKPGIYATMQSTRHSLAEGSVG